MMNYRHKNSIHPSSFILHPLSPVSLGDTFALASGLMEITYDTGAKVIVQGPATYEVESATGGYLSLGKLTARVEKKNDECGMMNDEVRTGRNGVHHSSFITHPLFAVRTPTAIVTDLGTEFGVRVLNDGGSEVHVLRGLVEAEFVNDGTRRDRKVKVAAGEAVQLDRGRMAIKRFDANPSIFVRTIVRPSKTLPALMVADDFAYPDGPLAGNNGGSAGAGSFSSAGGSEAVRSLAGGCLARVKPGL